MTTDDILENLFTQKEFDLFNVFKNVDLTDLKEVGTITETKNTESGIVTNIVTFNSFDNLHAFTKVNSYLEENAKYEEVQKLNQLIKSAVDKEDYNLAAKLKHEKDTILGIPKNSK